MIYVAIRFYTFLVMTQACSVFAIAEYGQLSKNSFTLNIPLSEVESFDWTKASNCLSPILNQLDCSASYAFAAVAAVEYYYCKHQNGGNFVKFSEQQIVDCSKNYYNCLNCYNNGCDSGWASHTFNYLQYIGGLMLNISYPYINAESRCNYNNETARRVRFASTSTTHVTYGPPNYDAVIKALQDIGPLTASIYATEDFHGYRGGVFKSTVGCPSSTSTNHVMLLVGFGTDPKEGDYWLLKNSWGTAWGENGYIRIARNRTSNICNILSWVNYPNLLGK